MRASLVACALALFAPISTGAIPTLPIAVEKISGTPVKGPSTSQLVSQGWGLDAPKLSQLNGTAFDWWYFDAVASDLSVGVVANVYTAMPASLWDYMPDTGSATWIGIWFKWANGTGKA